MTCHKHPGWSESSVRPLGSPGWPNVLTPFGGSVTVIRGKVNKQGFGGKGSGGGGGVWLCQKKPPFPSHSDLHLLQHPEPDSGDSRGEGPWFP